MSRAVPRASAAWIIVAHVCGATFIGALDSARLHSGGIAVATVPLFAFVGLIAALVSISVETIAARRPWWQSALVLAAPGLVVFAPVSWTLFDGAYAQTLAIARVVPFVLPVLLWLACAAAIAAGRWLLREGDLTSRAIALLAVAGALGSIIWVERHILATGYPRAHAGATLVVTVLAGSAIRVTYRGVWWRGLSIAGSLIVGTVVTVLALLASMRGLREAHDRELLAMAGDQTRDLVHIARGLVDRDNDGSSTLLGGGDCDDHDRARHPGAVDVPGDGIDQDCDGSDAQPVAVVPPPAPPPTSFRDRPDVVAELARTRGMNVLLVSVDALRADLLGPDAPDRADFPHLTHLLDESVSFTRAFAPASGTDVSLATLLTGRFNPFQPVTATLPEALRRSGRATFAALPTEVLRYAGETLLHRGIDSLTTVRTDRAQVDVGDHISADATSAAGIQALDAAGQRPFFVWVHYFDVHEHHQIQVPHDMLAKVQRGHSDRSHAYRALLRGIDDELGALLAELDRRGLRDKTIVVFMSDHGESLGEDPRLLATHGKVTYASLVRVPLAFRIPGVNPGHRDDLVSLVDIAPTLLDLLGVAHDDMPLDGTDLVPALLDAPADLRPAGRALAIHEQDQWSVVEWPYQLLVRPHDAVTELYDLETDPAQKQNLAATETASVQRLKARYAEFPSFAVDRTPQGRSSREQLARQHPNPAPR